MKILPTYTKHYDTRVCRDIISSTERRVMHRASTQAHVRYTAKYIYTILPSNKRRTAFMHVYSSYRCGFFSKTM